VINLGSEKKYQSLLGIVVGFLIISYIFEAPKFMYAAAIIGFLGLLSKSIAYWIHYAWMKVAALLGFINTYVLLTVIFFLLLFPISLLYRFFNRDSLNLKNKEASFFKDRNQQYTKADLENPW